MCQKKKMSMTAGTGNILCPFFIAHNSESICCEGIMPGMANMTTKFTDALEKAFHQRTYCEAEYKKCGIYETTMRIKWDDGE